jgi:gamma-glutamylcyclotransferase (GGCT)/AIG2-like uncharacterized protein YtfP
MKGNDEMTDNTKQPKPQWWELEDDQMELGGNIEDSHWDKVWQDSYWDDAKSPSSDDGFSNLTDNYYGQRIPMNGKSPWVPGEYVAPTYNHTPDRYYFAYGSNLHDPQMTRRCKDAVPHASCTLAGWRLVFRGVADIERGNPTDYVHGAIYKVSEWDEAQLDIYESFPSLYRKEYFDAVMESGETIPVMFYKMNTEGYGTPPKGYFDTIADGFIHWGLETEKLEEAVRFTESNKGGKVSKRSKKPHGYARWQGKGAAGVLGHPANSTLVGARIEAIRTEQLAPVPQPTLSTNKSSQKRSGVPGKNKDTK